MGDIHLGNVGSIVLSKAIKFEMFCMTTDKIISAHIIDD